MKHLCRESTGASLKGFKKARNHWATEEIDGGKCPYCTVQTYVHIHRFIDAHWCYCMIISISILEIRIWCKQQPNILILLHRKKYQLSHNFQLPRGSNFFVRITNHQPPTSSLLTCPVTCQMPRNWVKSTWVSTNQPRIQKLHGIIQNRQQQPFEILVTLRKTTNPYPNAKFGRAWTPTYLRDMDSFPGGFPSAMIQVLRTKD